jgi:hypothetical protein
MDLMTTLIVLAGGSLLYAWLNSPRTEGVLDTVGSGFLPYREPGWPLGVQEEEPMPWHWSSMAVRAGPPEDREPAPDAGVEIFEIEPVTSADLTEVGSGHVEAGGSIRPH